MVKCLDLYDRIRGVPADKAEKDRVIRLAQRVKERIEANGGDARAVARDLVEGKSSARKLAQVVDQYVEADNRNQTRVIARSLREEVGFMRHVEAARTSKKNGLIGLVAQQDAGTMSLEKMIAVKKADWIANRIQRGLDELTGGRWQKLFRDRQFQSEFSSEYFAIHHRQPGRASKNDMARQVAELVHRTLDEQRVSLRMKGALRPWHDTGLKIKFDYRKIAKNPEQAVQDIALALAESVHGPLERRTAVAKSMVDQLIKGRGVVDLDRFGDLLQPGAASDATPWAVIEYGDAARFSRLNLKYGRKDLLEGLLDQMESLSKKDAVATLGLSPSLIQRIGKEVGASQREIDKAVELFNRQTTVRIPDHIVYAKSMAALRALQTSAKLGSAVISAIADLPVMIYVARKMYNLGTFDALTHLLRGLTPAARKRAAYIGSWCEGVRNYHRNRFGARADIVTGIPNRAADFILNASGLNAWTSAAKAGATRMLDYKLGQLIRAKTSWADLAHTEPQLFYRLSRFGLTERDWYKLKQHHVEDGHFDLLALDRELSVGVTTREKLIGFYSEMTENAVITPGLLDRDFIEGDGSREFRKLVTQFLSFGSSVQRRLILGTIRDDRQSMLRKMTGLSGLMLSRFMVNLVLVQARESASGQQLYSWDDPELAKRAIKALPLGLAYSLFMDVVGDKIFDAVTGNKSFNDSDRADQLGVVLGGLAHVMEYGADSFQDGTAGNIGRRRLVRELLATVPGQNLWWARAIYRSQIVDQALEAVDPKGYKRSQKTMRQNAKEQRQGGKLRNFYGDYLDQLGR